MPYTTFGNGYDWRGADGRPDFVSIDNTPQGLPALFQNGFQVGPQNPVDQHVAFAQATYAGGGEGGGGRQPQQSGVSPAVSAMQSIRDLEEQRAAAVMPSLMRDYGPQGPTGYGTLPGSMAGSWGTTPFASSNQGPEAMIGGNRVTTSDPEAYMADERQRQSARRLGELNRTNAAGTNTKFLSDSRVSGFSLEMLEKMHDGIFGQGSLRHSLIGDQLAQQRAAMNPSGYTPVTLRDVDEYIAGQSPNAIKASSEKLAEFHKQTGMSGLDFLHGIGANNMATIPEIRNKDGTTTPARQVYADPSLQANLRKALNATIGQGSFPAPLSDSEAMRAAELHRQATEGGPWNNTPFGSINPAINAPAGMSMGIPIDPNISPVHQFTRGVGAQIGPAWKKWIGDTGVGAIEHIANAPDWWLNFIRAQNKQVPLGPLHSSPNAFDGNYWPSM